MKMHFLAYDYKNVLSGHKDHLGNVGLSYKNTSTTGVNLAIVEENNYYPFGLKHKGYNNNILAGARDHKYGFGGKEEQSELGLEWIDIIARNYDPAIGRWMNIDPLAEQMRRHSPYNYAFDNPIYFTDPDGMAPQNPGDRFQSREAAAKDFALLYNGISIINGAEVQSTLYKATVKGETFYSYTVPTGLENNNTTAGSPEDAPKGTEEVGSAHTHAYDPEGRPDSDGLLVTSINEVSPSDVDLVKDKRKQGLDYVSYVSTPKGDLLAIEEPEKGTSGARLLESNIPSDPLNPSRNKPNVSPNVIPEILPRIISETTGYPIELKTKF